MDRWYNAEDGNIWISFPSADRNKIDEETFLILKKKHNSHEPVTDLARYKAIAINNSAPDFIKTNKKSLGQLSNDSAKNDIGSSTEGFPLPNYQEIWVKHDTPGSVDLHAAHNADKLKGYISDGTLWLRVRTSSIKSEWYQVNSMVGSFDSGSGSVKFKLDKPFKDDVDFASVDGTMGGAVDDLRIELSNWKVENKKEFEGRFFVKIYKDLVLLQNLLTSDKKSYKVLSATKIGYWNQPTGYRNSHGGGGSLVDWESPAVNCKAELDAVSGYRNRAFGVNYASNSSDTSGNDKYLFFYAHNGIHTNINGTSYAAYNNAEKWYDNSIKRFHIDAIYCRAARETVIKNEKSKRKLWGGKRGRGMPNDNSMDIGYIHNYQYDWSSAHKEFYEKITTAGTTFRFREDIDGVIYKVTGSHLGNMGASNTSGEYGHLLNYANSSGDPGNAKSRFRVDFEQVGAPGVGMGAGPSGYHILGGNPKTKVSGVQELGYWGGRHLTPGWNIGGGGDDGFPSSSNDMNVPLPPNYQQNSVKTSQGAQLKNDGTSGVTGIEQARRWRQHAQKYHHIEIVEEMMDDEDWSSTNPATWETEPKEDVGMDIYYEASGAIPTEINSATNELFAPIGSLVDRDYAPSFPDNTRVKSWSSNEVTLTQSVQVQSGARVRFIREDGFISTAIVNSSYTSLPNAGSNVLSCRAHVGPATPAPNYGSNDYPHNQIYTLSWWNAFAFGNGIESDRIRDDYNQATISNGVKASTVLAEQYKEDRRKTGLIHSGIYNSTSNVNKLNQFIAAEKITKDMNPTYGSIQKLHTRDTNIVVMHEDKIMKVLADKDALYNADGGKNVAISANFLGSDQPFATNYGISTNPESFATDLSGRVYFSDRSRGAVLRLSQDGITNISDYGMKDWFNDNLNPLTQKVLGSFDDKKGLYNITIKGLYPVSLTGIDVGDEVVNTTEEPDVGAKCGCVNNNENVSQEKDPRDTRDLEGTRVIRTAENINTGRQLAARVTTTTARRIQGEGVIREGGRPREDIRVQTLFTVDAPKFFDSVVTLSFSENSKGWVSFKSFIPESGLSINNEYYTFKEGQLYQHHTNSKRNNFYNEDYESTFCLLFNDDPSAVKSFTELNYEGTQARIKKSTQDKEYYNLTEKKGWYVDSINTNLQDTEYLEFINKEGKWFSSIKGITTTLQNLDESEFSVQGIGSYASMEINGDAEKEVRCVTISPILDCGRVYGCTDRNAPNYNPSATHSDGSCNPIVDDCNINIIDEYSTGTPTVIPIKPTIVDAGINFDNTHTLGTLGVASTYGAAVTNTLIWEANNVNTNVYSGPGVTLSGTTNVNYTGYSTSTFGTVGIIPVRDNEILVGVASTNSSTTGVAVNTGVTTNAGVTGVAISPCAGSNAIPTTWVTGSGYATGDVVIHNGYYYINMSGGLSGPHNEPGTSGGAKWNLCGTSTSTGTGSTGTGNTWTNTVLVNTGTSTGVLTGGHTPVTTTSTNNATTTFTNANTNVGVVGTALPIGTALPPATGVVNFPSRDTTVTYSSGENTIVTIATSASTSINFTLSSSGTMCNYPNATPQWYVGNGYVYPTGTVIGYVHLPLQNPNGAVNYYYANATIHAGEALPPQHVDWVRCITT
jgi:hypothetical protein